LFAKLLECGPAVVELCPVVVEWVFELPNPVEPCPVVDEWVFELPNPVEPCPVVDEWVFELPMPWAAVAPATPPATPVPV